MPGVVALSVRGSGVQSSAQPWQCLRSIWFLVMAALVSVPSAQQQSCVILSRLFFCEILAVLLAT